MHSVVCTGVVEDESTDHNAVHDEAEVDKLETKMNGVKLVENEAESIDDKNVKKKRKFFKKKSGAKANDVPVGKQQTVPPSIPISELYSNGIFHFSSEAIFVSSLNIWTCIFSLLGVYPIGQETDHPKVPDDRLSQNRVTYEEKKAVETAYFDIYNDARQAAEAHRQVYPLLN